MSHQQCRMALLALQACGAGLNLEVANICVFVKLCWTPKTLKQTEAHVHRMGEQAADVLMYYLVAGGRALQSLSYSMQCEGKLRQPQRCRRVKASPISTVYVGLPAIAGAKY